MNATIEKFGYPASLVAEYDHWLVLVRPAQVTLGSLVVAAKGEATAYGALPAAAFVEQGRMIAEVERALARFTAFERINYLMLMMVDPHVHFHVLPRYSAPRDWAGVTFADTAWPGPPDLAAARPLAGEQIERMASDVKRLFC